jgi:predicted PurR-regulated permease PerM
MRSVQLEISTNLILKVAFVAAALMIGWELRSVVLSIVVLLFIAFIINAGLRPIIQWLKIRFKVPRSLAVAIIYLGTIAFLSVAFVVIASQFVNQLVNLIQSLPDIFASFANFIEQNIPVLANILPLDNLRNELGAFAFQIINTDAFRNFASGENIFAVLRQGLGVFSSVAELLVSVVTVIMISIYMNLREQPAYEGVLDLLPTKKAKTIRTVIQKIESSLGGWLLGQFTAMVSIGFITYFLVVIPGLFIADYRLDDFALPIALMAGLLEALPNIGPLLTLIITAILALGTSGFGVVIYVIIAFTALQQLEGIVLIPMVMKHAVGIDPILSILGIISGFALGGIVGAILAIPVIGIAQIIITEVADEYKRYERQRPKLVD